MLRRCNSFASTATERIDASARYRARFFRVGPLRKPRTRGGLGKVWTGPAGEVSAAPEHASELVDAAVDAVEDLLEYDDGMAVGVLHPAACDRL